MPGEPRHHKVKEEGDLPDGHIAVAGFQQPDDDIRAAGAGIGGKDDAKTGTAQHAAVKRSDDGLHLGGGDHAEQIQKRRQGKGTDQRPYEEFHSNLLASYKKQRQVQKCRDHAYRSEGKQTNDDHRQAGDAAGVQTVGFQK